jgi:hypothetical protein
MTEVAFNEKVTDIMTANKYPESYRKYIHLFVDEGGNYYDWALIGYPIKLKPSKVESKSGGKE